MTNEPEHKALIAGLRKSFFYRVEAIFYGRLSLNSLYLILWVISFVDGNGHFSKSGIDLALILFAFTYALASYHFKRHNLGRWLHFITLIMDVMLHVFFTRNSNFLLSPLMAIHPFLSSAFLLLFHNPLLLLAPLSSLPISVALTVIRVNELSTTQLLDALIMSAFLDALAIFFIHLAQSKEHRLLTSFVVMEKELERQRISRDFHDGVGAKLVSIVMQCDHVQMTSSDHLLCKEIDEIKESAIEAIDDMRRSISCLHGDFDVVEKILSVIDKMNSRHRTKITTHDLSPLRSLSVDQQLTCCRIIEEGLTNALKHAQASNIILSLIRNPIGITMCIKDDGLGFDMTKTKQHHFGLKNMLSRARSLGGELSHSSTKDGGTTVTLHIPHRENHIYQ